MGTDPDPVVKETNMVEAPTEVTHMIGKEVILSGTKEIRPELNRIMATGTSRHFFDIRQLMVITETQVECIVTIVMEVSRMSDFSSGMLRVLVPLL